MVLLTPKFVFVAVLASLTAFSLAPTADAAAIAMRRSHQPHPSDSSGTWSSSPSNDANHPLIPLPARLTPASGKQTQDRSETSPRGSLKVTYPSLMLVDRSLTIFRLAIQRQGPRDFFASQRRSLTPEDLPPLLTRRDYSHHSHGLAPPRTAAQQSVQEERGSGPHVHINGANSHVAFDRRTPVPAPDPHHGHHHHGSHHDDHHHHGSEHTDDVVVIKGDNDDVHISRRSPLPDPHHRHHHHHHHGRRHGGRDMSVVEKDNNIGRRSPDPRHEDHGHHHHHNHHGHHKGHGSNDGDKVIIEGDDNNVSVDSRSRIARHQHHDHSPEHTETAAHESYQHYVQARKYIPRHQPHHDVSPTDHVEHIESAHHTDRDRTEKHTRSVLINSVEGKEAYLVPDDYRGQRVTVIEGDGISKALTKAKRGGPGIEGVPGSVDIMVRFPSLSFAHPTQHFLPSRVLQSDSAKSEDGQRIASLFLVHPDATMAELGNNTFSLNASEGNYTQLYLVALNTTNSGVEGEDVPVALKVPVFNPDSASMEGYCATYDPQPPAPAPLSAEPCFYDEPTAPHKSQVFAYTPSTSVIRPMWFNGEGDSLSDSISNSTAQPDATVDPGTPLSDNVTSVTSVGDFGNSTAPPSIAAFDNSTGIEEELIGSGSGNGSTTPTDEDLTAKAQNVTLIFTPAAPIIPSSSKKPIEDLPDSDETPLSGSNSTDTDTSASPLASDISGSFNDTETGWTGYSDDNETSSSSFPAASIPLPNSVPSPTVSPAAIPSESVSPEEDKDLNVVMVGVARDETSGGVGTRDSGMTAVSTDPYKWKFDRERS